MKKQIVLILVLIGGISSTNAQEKNEWVSLFDGKTLNGWHQYNGTEIGDEWSVNEGELTFQPKENRQWGDGGKNIVTDKEYTSFILSLEWKISEAGNSGIFWGVKEGEAYGEPYVTGPEIQILDFYKLNLTI